MKKTYVYAFVFLLVFLPRLYPALSTFYLVEDTVEYLNIARHIAHGEGPLLSIKARLLDQRPVIRSGACCRFLGFPLAAAGILTIVDSPLMVQLFNVLLISGALLLIFILYDRLFGRRIALLSAILLAFHPLVYLPSIAAFTEPLSLLLIALLLLLWITVQERREVVYVVAGVIVGFASLVRPTNIVLVPALVLDATLFRKEPRWLLKLTLLASGLGIILLPPLYHVAQQLGDFPFSDYRWFFTEAIQSLGYTFLVTRVFMLPPYYLFVLALYLLPFSLFLPTVVRRAVRREYAPAANLLLAIALFNLLLHSALWGQVAPRYVLLSFLLLLPFCLDVLFTKKSRTVAATFVVCALMLSLLLGPIFLHIPAFQKTGAGPAVPWAPMELLSARIHPEETHLFNHDLDSFIAWIKTSLHESDVIGTFHPHIVNFFTERPAIVLPEPIDDDILQKFIAQYHIKYILVNAEYDLKREFGRVFTYGIPLGSLSKIDRKPVFDYVTILTQWQKRGWATLTQIGSYAIYSIVPSVSERRPDG